MNIQEIDREIRDTAIKLSSLKQIRAHKLREMDLEPNFRVMKEAIAAVLDRLDKRDTFEKSFWHPFALAQETRSVSVNLGRRMGHSTFIQKTANSTDVVIVKNELMKQLFAYSPAKIYSNREFDSESFYFKIKGIFKSPPIVYIDYASGFSKAEIARIYELFCDKAKLFVLLG